MKTALKNFRIIGVAILISSLFSAAAFALKVATPTFSPGAGTYTTFQSVTISCATSGATIRYTINGSAPSTSNGTIYTGPVSITATATLKAIAYKSGYTNSDVAAALYTINLIPVVNPTFNPVAGAYAGAQTVTIASSTSGAGFRYTIDGSTPTAINGVDYTGPVTVSQNTTIKAYGFKTGMANSSVVSAVYTIQCAAPAFSPAPGTYNSSQTVTLTSATSGASIRYTVDGMTPTATTGTVYSTGISVTLNTTIKAIAYKSGMIDSSVASATYSIQCGVPAFNPAPSAYNTVQTVTLTSTTSGASIRYTTDGTTPTSTSGILYSSAIAVGSTTTIKAIAYKTGMTDSDVASGLYTIQLLSVAVPVFSPAGGTYASAQSVTITSGTSGATIRYTTDGTQPSQVNGTVYSSALSISANTTLKAIAYKSGMIDSDVASAVYSIQCTEPSFNPAPGTYNTIQTVTLTSPTSGASINYTTDGSIPTSSAGTLYTSAITASSTTTIKAVAFKSGMVTSIITSGTFTIQLVQVAAPELLPAGGTFNSVQSVTLTSATSGSSIRYTTDGSVPSQVNGSIYSAPVSISSTTTIKAIAFKTGMIASDIISGTYRIQCAAPAFSPAAGSFERPQTVTLTSATSGASIRYTTDGTIPDQSTGILYANAVQVNISLTIKAVAYKTSFENSEVTEGKFVLGSEDTDGDGVIDAEDDYPNDPQRALNNFFPATGKGSLAFEDLWPAKGDYDINDVVVDYSFKTITNGSNKLVETYATFVLRATGATLKNGFGFQLAGTAIPASGISVTGMKLTNNYVTLTDGGTEANQTIPTFIVFDNAFDILKHPGTGSGINTTPGAPFVDPVTIELHIVFTADTYAAELLDIEHFNPFIIIDMVRNREVHLPDYAPTSLVDQSLFGTVDDNTNVPGKRYYKTQNNLPWAFNIYESFDYPIEKAAILKTYLHFAAWAQSSGKEYPDWYKNLAGYRNEDNIYKH